eukprot:g555.t1
MSENKLVTLVKTISSLDGDNSSHQIYQTKALRTALMMGYANAMKTNMCMRAVKHVAHKIDEVSTSVETANKKIEDQYSTIGLIDNNISSLTQSLEVERNRNADLIVQFEKQKEDTRALADEWRSAMRRHKVELEQQEKLLKKLSAFRIRSDGIADFSIVLCAAVFAGSPATDVPIRVFAALLNMLPLSRRVRRKMILLIEALRWISFLVVARQLRAFATQFGWHSGSGNFYNYVESLKTMIFKNYYI